jgi:uncharacterized membrane protein
MTLSIGIAITIYLISMIWVIWLFNYLEKIGVKGYKELIFNAYIPVVNTIVMLISLLKLFLGIMDRRSRKRKMIKE